MKIKKNTNPNVGGTSYFGVYIETTVGKLIDIANAHGVEYKDNNGGGDKTNFNFAFKLEDGTIFTVYDWKYYRRIGKNETLEFNIGGFNNEDTIKAKKVLVDLINTEDKVYVCPECGSDKIYIREESKRTGGIEDNWCMDCEKNIPLD